VLSRPLERHVLHGTFLSHFTRRLAQLEQAVGALWLFRVVAIYKIYEKGKEPNKGANAGF
jgi:hypothetical protein